MSEPPRLPERAVPETHPRGGAREAKGSRGGRAARDRAAADARHEKALRDMDELHRDVTDGGGPLGPVSRFDPYPLPSSARSVRRRRARSLSAAEAAAAEAAEPPKAGPPRAAEGGRVVGGFGDQSSRVSRVREYAKAKGGGRRRECGEGGGGASGIRGEEEKAEEKAAARKAAEAAAEAAEGEGDRARRRRRPGPNRRPGGDPLPMLLQSKSLPPTRSVSTALSAFSPSARR